MSRSVFIRLVVATGLLLAGSARAAVITVDDDGVQCPTRNQSSIQAAVTAAAAGDTIDVCPGTYSAFSTQGKNGLTIRSTAGASTTLVRGFANGCYGIYIPSGTGITIDGFDISPNVVTSGNSCDWAAIATSNNVFDLAIRNNVVHDILAPGSRSCGTGSGSYGIIGFGLNDVHRAVIENNNFYNMNNPGCTPVSPYAGVGTTIKSFASAVQVIFVSGSNNNGAPGSDLITVRNNTIQSASAFNPTAIRVKRATNFALTGNVISGLVATDGTPSFPSTTRGLNPQGSPTTASVQGVMTGNTVTADYGVILEDYNSTSITGNNFSGVGTTHVYFVRSNNNFACTNTLNPAANFNVASPATGNTFPNGASFPGNISCPAPTITCPDPLTVQCNESVPAPDPGSVTATDNCAGGIAPVAFISDTPSGSCPKTITRLYRATDACGVAADCTQTIVVDDTTAPIVTQGSIASCYATQAAAEAAAIAATTATDNCLGPLVKTAATSGTCSATVTVTVHDACDNTAQATYSTRIDSTPPSITAPAPTTVECADDVPPPSPGSVSATDNCGTPVVTFVGDATSGTGCLMTVTRTYRATDACGNSTDGVQVITVHDTTGPTVGSSSDNLYCLSPPNGNYRCFTQADFPQVTASLSDNCDNAPLTWVFSSCVSDQPDPSGDDCVIAPDGRSFMARSERETRGHEEGRHYRLTVIAEDGCGNHGPVTQIGFIHVPKNAKKSDGCLAPNCGR